MRDELKKFFAGKKIVILGFGREGKSSYELIRKLCPAQKITIADQKMVAVDDENVELVCGEGYLENLAQYDVIMKSPGVSLKTIETQELTGKITSQLELLLQFFRGRTIGVTGTKGKSTTSSLVFKILQDQKVPSMLLGNIGVPVFEHIEEIAEEMTLVLEMSSHQLEFMRHSPNVALLLNVFPEHLDHYRSFADYAQAKCNIFRYQSQNDILLYGAEGILEEWVQTAAGRKFEVGLTQGDVKLADGKVWFGTEEIYDATARRELAGDYNLLNMMFALGVAKILDLDLKQAAQSVNEFRTLAHRLEFVAERAGVKYYDNAIGTVPAATMAAMQALGDVDTVIVGGMDRGLDYGEFGEFLRNDKVRNVICMPETGEEIMRLVGEKAVWTETMLDAVKLAAERTARGKSCLLSPAAASYGRFKNFEEKGDLFQKLVRELGE